MEPTYTIKGLSAEEVRLLQDLLMEEDIKLEEMSEENAGEQYERQELIDQLAPKLEVI